MIWDGEVDDWVCDEDDEMNEGFSGDNERIPLWDSESDFLGFLWGWGRGNSNEAIPNFSLCDLVNIWEEGKCEEKLAWDNLVLLETEKSLSICELKTKIWEFLQKKDDLISLQKH